MHIALHKGLSRGLRKYLKRVDLIDFTCSLHSATSPGASARSAERASWVVPDLVQQRNAG